MCGVRKSDLRQLFRGIFAARAFGEIHACVRKHLRTYGCTRTRRRSRMCPAPRPRRFPRRGFCGTLLRPRSGVSRLFCARAPPTSAAAIAGERTDRQTAHGNCAGFFRRYIEIASANGYNRLKHMPAVRISAGVKFEKGRYYHENNPHPE